MSKALVERVRALGLSFSEAERRAVIPAGFLSKLAAGRNGGPRARKSVEALERFLVAQEGPRQARAGHDSDAGPGARVATPGAPASLHAVADTFLDRCRGANSIELVDSLLGELLGGAWSGQLDGREVNHSSLRMMIEVLHERRMVLREVEEKRARIDGGKPLRVEVVWTSDWRPKSSAASG